LSLYWRVKPNSLGTAVNTELMHEINLSLRDVKLAWRRIQHDILAGTKISKEAVRDDGNFDRPTNFEKR